MTVYFQDNEIKGVLFDKDGTLLDFEQTFGPACKWVLEQLSQGDDELCQKMADSQKFNLETLTFAPDSVVIAGTNDDIIATMLPLLGDWQGDNLRVEIDRLFGESTLANLVAFEGVSELLLQLSDADVGIGLATNDAEQNGRAQLDAMGIAGFFDFIIGYDSGYGAKPEPGMIHGFADHVCCSASQVLMVGDSSHDLNAAKASGALFAGVGQGVSLQMAKSRADLLIETISDLGQHFLPSS